MRTTRFFVHLVLFIALGLSGCHRKAASQPAASPAEPAPGVRALIVRSVGEGARSPQWFGDWYLLYTEDGYLKAAIARPTSSGGTRVTLVTLERVVF